MKVLDLNAVVKAWAQEMFRISKTKEQGKIPQDDLVYRVNWNRAKILHKEPEYQVGFSQMSCIYRAKILQVGICLADIKHACVLCNILK